MTIKVIAVNPYVKTKSSYLYRLNFWYFGLSPNSIFKKMQITRQLIIQILAATLFSIFAFGQEFEHTLIPNFPSHQLKIIKVTPTAIGSRAFLMAKDYITNTPAAEPVFINVLWVMDSKGGGQYELVGEHILYNPALPATKNQTLKRHDKTIGKASEIVTYDEIIAIYPELSDIDRLDKVNRKEPNSFYVSKLNISLLKEKVKGFESTRYSNSSTSEKPKKLSESKDKKKKKGLMNRLAEANASVNKLNDKIAGKEAKKAKFEKAQETSADWEDDYNGGQDKKNFWKSIEWMSSQSDGNLLAINGHKKKGDDQHIHKAKEIILISPEGETLKREEWNSDIPWIKIRSSKQFKKTPDGAMDINFMAMASKNSDKNGDKNQVHIMGIKGNADILYDHTYTLPMEYKRIDTLITTADQKTIMMGTMNKVYNKFVLVSTAESQKLYTFDITNKDPSKIPHSFVSTVQGDYVIYQVMNFKTKAPMEFHLHHLSDEAFGNPTIVENSYKDSPGSNLEFLVNDKENILIQIKEITKIKGYADKISLPTIYRLSEGGLTKIANFDSHEISMTRVMNNKPTQIFKDGDAYYYVAKIMHPNHSGHPVPKFVVTKMTL